MQNDEKLLLQTPRFRVVQKSYTTADGARHERAVVEHPGAVVILPLFDDGRVCLIRNQRIAVGQHLLELPAGTLEPGEAPQTTATRELEEETGYTADSVQPLHSFWMSPGILNERMHLFVARGLRPGQGHLDQGEVIDPVVVTWDECLALARRGDIQDAKTLVGIFWYHDLRQRAGD